MLDYIDTEVSGKKHLINNTSIDRENIVEPTYEKNIPLLEERVIVNYQKHKVGEVIVHKQIEIRNIQVPVRREKLIVQQLGGDQRLLAEIDLSQGEVSGVELVKNQEFNHVEASLTANGEFDSPEMASLVLNAIALDSHHGCQRVKLQLTLETELQQKKCQEWMNRFAQAPQPKSPDNS